MLSLNKHGLSHVWEWMLRVGNPYVSHWLFPGWLTLAAYVLVCLYFTYKDVMRHESKIQKDWWPSLGDMARAAVPQLAVYTGLNGLFTYLYPIYLELPQEAPSLLGFFLEVATSFVVGDFLIYAEHRVMHAVPFLRNSIHSVHHAYHAPFGWAGGWVHPLEDAVVVACQVAFPLSYGVHPLSLWAFTFVWVLLLIEEHSGHDVFWAPYNWMPFARWPTGGGGAPHDIHHYRPTKNFGFVLIIWDQLFGTYTPVLEPPVKPANYAQWWEWQPVSQKEK
ncbi:MAG: sterol desaturase family protein [archaeon]|nr:sterol desaturase family protein [archaeon]